MRVVAVLGEARRLLGVRSFLVDGVSEDPDVAQPELGRVVAACLQRQCIDLEFSCFEF